MIATVILQSQTWELLIERVRGLLSIGGQVIVDWLLALMVIVIGWVIARLLETITLYLLRALRFNQGVRGLLGPTGTEPAHEPAAFASWAVRWTVVVVTVLLALDVLGLN